MKKIFTRIVAALTVLTLMLCAAPMNSSADGEMAYNMYTSPDMSAAGDVHTTYMIDFRAPQSVYGTYWALANFGMDFSKETKKAYKNIKLGGCYAGLQHYKGHGSETDRLGILSFWHWEYFGKDENGKMGWVELNASQMYPDRVDDPFGGEGTGMQSIHDYAWQPNQWYTMVLHSWEDVENDSTFVGLWFLDQESGKWELNTYYDTHLINSGLTGDMGLFMENFISSRREGVREYNVKNMYVLDKATEKWNSINKVTLSYSNGGKDNKVGTHEYGYNEEEGYLWGITDGTMREDQAEHDKAWPESKVFKIQQPAAPTFGTLVTSELKSEMKGSDLVVSWTAGETSTPQIGAKVEIVDESGKVVATKEMTRPELTSMTLSDTAIPEEYICRLTVTDIFGQTAVTEKATAGYEQGGEPTPSPEPSEDDKSEAEPSVPAPQPSENEESVSESPAGPAPQPSTSDKDDEKDDSDKSGLGTGGIIAIVAGSVVAVGAVAIAAVFLKKKKK